MARPQVQVVITNDNLGLRVPLQTGTSVVLVASPAAPTAGYGTAFLVSSKADVAAAFAAAGNEPVVAAFNNGFYAEAPEGTKVYVLAMAQSTMLETLLAAANADKALLLAGGQARLLAAIKFPAGGYTPTVTDGFDEDVHDAITAAQTLAAAWQLQNKGFRALIQGFGFTTIAAARDYSTASNRNVACVVGSVSDSTALATLLALGRAAAIEPQQNIGRVKTGSLNIAAAALVKIAATVVDNISKTDLNTLHNKRYITFERNENASGYIFQDDNMLTEVDDDYNNLAYGRIIDNAQRIAYTEYYEELKDDVEVDAAGRLSAVVEKALETKIESAIDADMRGQLSKRTDGSADVRAMVNPDPVQYAALYAKNGITNPNLNVIQSQTIYLFLFLKPKGFAKYINVYLGLTATSI